MDRDTVDTLKPGLRQAKIGRLGINLVIEIAVDSATCAGEQRSAAAESFHNQHTDRRQDRRR